MADDPTPSAPASDEEAVRALLASLREADPSLPPEVAARLDARLAGLAEPTADPAGHPEGTVVSLPARPANRRTARGVLVAAAVAAVVGLGTVQVLDPLGGGSDGDESAAGETAVTADQPAAGDREGGAALESAPQSREGDDLATEDTAGAPPGRLPSLSTRSFALDVAALPVQEASTPRPATDCTPGALPPATDLRAVLLDGRPGVLALLPAGAEGAAADSRVAEAWQCRDLAGPAGTAAPPRVRVVVGSG